MPTTEPAADAASTDPNDERKKSIARLEQAWIRLTNQYDLLEEIDSIADQIGIDLAADDPNMLQWYCDEHEKTNEAKLEYLAEAETLITLNAVLQQQ